MKRIILALAALGLAASPATAQQYDRHSSLPGDNTARAVAPAPPPPRSTSPAYVPPPFPPMPKLRAGQHKSSTKVTRAKAANVTIHRTTKASKATSRRIAKPHAAKSAKASKSRHENSSKRSDRASKRVEKVTLSKRTIRQCHAMSYSQILRHPNCRSLMSQELAEADHKAAAKKAKTTKKSKSTKAKSTKSSKAKSTKSTKRSHHRR